MNPVESLRSVLCDPEGNVVIRGSDGDREVIRQALEALAEQPAEGGQGEALARRFHETYERLAPSFGYETRKETRSFDPESANGKLMIAVCRELIDSAGGAKENNNGA